MHTRREHRLLQVHGRGEGIVAGLQPHALLPQVRLEAPVITGFRAEFRISSSTIAQVARTPVTAMVSNVRRASGWRRASSCADLSRRNSTAVGQATRHAWARSSPSRSSSASRSR
jgi:hypothetical protein